MQQRRVFEIYAALFLFSGLSALGHLIPNSSIAVGEFLSVEYVQAILWSPTFGPRLVYWTTMVVFDSEHAYWLLPVLSVGLAVMAWRISQRPEAAMTEDSVVPWKSQWGRHPYVRSLALLCLIPLLASVILGIFFVLYIPLKTLLYAYGDTLRLML